MPGSSTFPSTLDTFNDPGQFNSLSDAGFEHDLQHTKVNDAMLGVQAKVGVDSSILTTTLDYILKHHSHTGLDGSATLGAIVVQPPSDGVVMTLKNAGGSATLVQATTTTGGPTLLVQPPSAATQALALKQQSAGQSGDLLQAQSSGGIAQSGITGAGVPYSYVGQTLYKGVGGAAFLSTIPATGELDLVNGALLKGYSGVVGTGPQFSLDTSQGQMLLGGPTSGPTLRLNGFRNNRSSTFQMDGKNNANAGGLYWQEIVDADGQFMLARSKTVTGNLLKTVDGSAGPSEQFEVMGFPSYDGVVTDTKGIGFSVLPATAPVLTAGTLTISGATVINGNLTDNGTITTSALTVNAVATFTGVPVFPTGSYGTPGLSDVAQAASAGVATTFARSDHVHSREAHEVINSAIVQSTNPAPGNTVSQTYVTISGLPSVNYTKLRSDTKLLITHIVGGWNGLASGASVLSHAVRVNGTDIQTGVFWFNNNSVHVSIMGMNTVSSLAAGTVTLQSVVKLNGSAMNFSTDGNDFWFIKVEEVL